MKLQYYFLAFVTCVSLCCMGYFVSPRYTDMSVWPMPGYAYIVRNLYIIFIIFIALYLMKMYLDHREK